MTNKSFWKAITSFLTNKRIMSANQIFVFKREQLLINVTKIAEVLDVSYINIVEKLLGIKPAGLLDQENTDLSNAIGIIVEKYSSYLSVQKIKKNSLKKTI